MQYGPRVGALAVALWHGQFLAKARVAQIMGEVFGAPMAPGTVSSLAMDAMGILPSFTGVAVHDAWAPYDTYTGAEHSLCGAHLLRELVAVTESGTDGPRGGKAMARRALDALLVLKKPADDAHGAGTVPAPDRIALHRQILRSATLVGKSAIAGRRNDLIKKHHALFTRIDRRLGDYLRFVDDPRVPFDNNASEREIRMCKLRIKVSGCMRSQRGAAEFCRIRSYPQTTRKNGVGWLHALTDAMLGIPWTPSIATA